jgi:hypothetical protein
LDGSKGNFTVQSLLKEALDHSKSKRISYFLLLEYMPIRKRQSPVAVGRPKTPYGIIVWKIFRLVAP